MRDFFPMALETLGPMSSWHKSKSVWPRWRQNPVKRGSYSSACRSTFNAACL